MKFIFYDFKRGFDIYVKGYRAIFNTPGARLWAAIPFIINLIICFFGIAWGTAQVTALVTSALGLIFTVEAGIWYSLLYYPLFFLFWASFVVILVFIVYLIAGVISSPFNSMLAERVLVHLEVIEDRPFHFYNWFRTSIKMFFTSMLRLVMFLCIGVLAFILSFIPGLNIVGSYLALLMMVYDGFDYSFEAKQYNLQQRNKYFKKHIVDMSGAAAALGMAILVPGLPFLLMPLAVAGSAVVFKQGLRADEE